MKKRLIILMLIISVLTVGCSKSNQGTVIEDTKELVARVIELENENAELKSEIEVLNDNSQIDSNTDTEADIVTENQNNIKDINIGDTIITDRMELTVKNIELSYDVLPKDTSGYYTHYPANSGKVYIDIDTDIKNIQKQNLPCDELMKVEAEYNNGYKYTSMAVSEDNSGFTYANITSIIPLETMSARFLIECPQEVEETGNPLSLKFMVDNKEYKYVVR